MFAALTAALLHSEYARAQGMPCAPREQLVQVLTSEHKEQQEGQGLAPNGTIVELFVSPAGSWTILLSRPDGVSCIAAGGTDWEPAPVQKSAA